MSTKKKFGPLEMVAMPKPTAVEVARVDDEVMAMAETTRLDGDNSEDAATNEEKPIGTVSVPERLLGQIDAYCYMVQRGKPASTIPVQERYLETVSRTVTETHGLNIYVEPLSEGWVNVWIYKYPHILQVIQALQQAPKTVFDHWVLGKLFGYSEEAIHEFLRSPQVTNGTLFRNGGKENARAC